MTVLGGLTRLTGSGLSIVVWEPLGGVLPPLTGAQWEEAFAAYRLFPEFRQVNPDMDLAGFKSIYWLEYLHRLLGRLIGLAFLVPFAVFLVRRRMSRRLAAALGGIFLLGALQGLVGWYMVQSGLVDRPDVSHYRLAAHLGLAVLIYALLLAAALHVLGRGRAAADPAPRPGARRAAWLAVALVFATMVSGAFMAGLDAGPVFATFPLMNGRWIPEDVLAVQPWYVNFGENPITVHFVHRVLALAATLAAVAAWWRDRRRPAAGAGDRWLGHALLFALAAQVALGAATAIAGVPLVLALLHQAGAMVLLTICVGLAHRQHRR
ncbi:MAG: COX15/CtaA family protein [Alphaproteobacteria bacterium]|nr:COX15/CtaA family protein [Alphaproteobacteria bacterium]